MLLQQLPMREISIPTGQRKLGHLNDLVASIRRVGLLQPIVVTRKDSGYRVIAGRRRYHACKRLGWTEIPAIIVAGNKLLVELMKIDENLIRQELTTAEQGQQRRRRKAIHQTPHVQTRHGNGLVRESLEQKRKEWSASPINTPSKKKSTPRAIQHPVHIDADVSGGDSGSGSATCFALTGSRAPRVSILRLIARLCGVQHKRQSLSVHEPRRTVSR